MRITYQSNPRFGKQVEVAIAELTKDCPLTTPGATLYDNVPTLATHTDDTSVPVLLFDHRYPTMDAKLLQKVRKLGGVLGYAHSVIATATAIICAAERLPRPKRCREGSKMRRLQVLFEENVGRIITPEEMAAAVGITETLAIYYTSLLRSRYNMLIRTYSGEGYKLVAIDTVK